ncbi:hypothetical protein C2G38_2250803 [Gigaspora rosea]|uniref:Uncharacterized protein n=1 Tax=Gigaspora rosea TaxID=44941 RepID=A0A397UJJ5_9GLOM|nr:hypothetical protein C2G38_2250803 [Gigaspora rosea]
MLSRNEIESRVALALSSRGCRGKIYRKIRRYQEALKDLNKSLDIELDYASTLKFRAEPYFSMGWYDELIDDLNSSLELGPDDAEALCLRGAYRKIGRYGYSLEDLNR